ncbi:MAG: site-specific DNA-methyltransferase, partial [Planctomycetes bacterium]|nr:site-specific DNA-methyltransferase [Planctomycetota bacterium]
MTTSVGVEAQDERILELEALRKRLAELENSQTVGLVWKNSNEDVESKLLNELPVLISEAALGVGDCGTRSDSHVLIEGDNLHALHVLQATHRGKVDVIYIDPPYNTGGEFRYNDKLVDADDEWRHSKWLSFMARRLRLAHELLPDHGVILISIDDHEQSHLKMLCDKVFGTGNFVAQLVWQGGRKNDSRFVSVGHDYILIYAKSRQYLVDSDIRWRERKNGADEIMEAGARCWDESGHNGVRATALLKKWFKDLPSDHPARAHKHYNHICDVTGHVFFPDNISWPNGVGPKYEVLHPVTGKPVKVPSSGWRFPTPERMAEMIAAGKIHFGDDESKVPNRKSYL